MMAVFVNLFAALAYWAKLSSHANGDVGPAAQVHYYKYLDYLFTCPLLTVDLLWSLNLPYKFTYGGFVFICIVCAFMATILPPPARFMWFGLGITMFVYTWGNILYLVQIRLGQMVGKKIKKVRFYLKTACTTYFAIWLGYPTLWVMYEIGAIDPVTSHLMHVLFDVLAKSVYGFALLYFVVGGEKNDFVFLDLRPTVEKEEEEEEDPEAGIVIGSKSNKRQMKATKDSGHSFSDFNTRPYPAMNGEQGDEGGLESTQDELKRLNKQIETLMAQDGSA